MDFNEAIPIILQFEGGLVDHPRDPGGLTNMGITQRDYPDEDIKNITLDRVKEIYKQDYWDRNRCDEMPEKLRLGFFDCCVNQGGGAASRLLQRACNAYEDGKVGPKTMAKVSAMDSERLTIRFLAERALRYSGTRNFDTFGKGWMRRLIHITYMSGGLNE